MNSRSRVIDSLAIGGPAMAAAAYFIFGQTLWAVSGLGMVALASLVDKKLRKPFGFAIVLFGFLLLNFVISQLGIHYPYTNIFVLTGLLGLFSLTRLSWSNLFFSSGKSAKWLRPGILSGAALAIIVLLVVHFVPQALPANPVPRHWPIDVLLVVALGYATFSALTEETIFRSLMIAYATPHFSMPVAIAAQGLVFGLMHFRVGVPVGVAGVVLAGVWGLAAGWLVHKAQSIYPAYLMHFTLVLIVFLGLVCWPA